MGILTYPSPTYPRQQSFALCDSLGRVYGMGNHVTVDGGTTTDLNNSQWERYDPATGLWTTLPQQPTLVNQQNYILETSTNNVISAFANSFILGSSSTAPNDVFYYDHVGNSYTTLPNLSPDGEYSFNFNDQMWTTASGSNKFSVFSGGSGGTWTTKTNTSPGLLSGAAEAVLSPAGLNGPTGAVDGNGLFCFGIANTSTGAIRYNPLTDTWSRTSPATTNITGSFFHVYDGSRYIYNMFRTNFHRYDTQTDTWTNLNSVGPATFLTNFNQFGTVIADANFIWGFGYSNLLSQSFANIIEYDVVAQTWSDTGDLMGLIGGTAVRVPYPVKDPIGVGYYLFEGQGRTTGQGCKIFEYWVPHGVPPPPPALGGNFVAMF